MEDFRKTRPDRKKTPQAGPRLRFLARQLGRARPGLAFFVSGFFLARPENMPRYNCRLHKINKIVALKRQKRNSFLLPTFVFFCADGI
jgi:hypothetical protein